MKIEDELQSNFRNEYHKGLVNLYFTNMVVVEEFLITLRKNGLAAPQFNVLRILSGQHPTPASIGLIKERMLDKSSDVSRIVERLFKKDLVERTEGRIDRRQKEVIISSKGLKLLDKLVMCEELEDTALSNLTVKEVKTLNNLLDKIRMKGPSA